MLVVAGSGLHSLNSVLISFSESALSFFFEIGTPENGAF